MVIHWLRFGPAYRNTFLTIALDSLVEDALSEDGNA